MAIADFAPGAQHFFFFLLVSPAQPPCSAIIGTMFDFDQNIHHDRQSVWYDGNKLLQ
jgi:hypothetical protein